MRWILFDIVVGAALVWLVWDARTAGPAVAPATEFQAARHEPALQTPALQETAPQEPASQEPEPLPPPPPAEAPAPIVAGPLSASPTREDPPFREQPAPAPVSRPEDRHQRLRVVAREMEDLFLRARE